MYKRQNKIAFLCACGGLGKKGRFWDNVGTMGGSIADRITGYMVT